MPVIDFKSLKVHFSCRSNVETADSYFNILFLGRLAVMFSVLRSIPRKVRHRVGPSVLCSAIGTPIWLHKCRKFESSSWHFSLELLINRKSSRTFTIDFAPYCFVSIQCRESVNFSKIWHDEEQPCGRHLS